MILFHWTSRNLAETILAEGAIKPMAQMGEMYRLKPSPIVCLTDIPARDAHAIGLINAFIPYDRTEARFTLELEPRTVWKFHKYAAMFQLKPDWKRALTKGGKIDHHRWWVTGHPLPVTEDMVIYYTEEVPNAPAAPLPDLRQEDRRPSGQRPVQGYPALQKAGFISAATPQRRKL